MNKGNNSSQRRTNVNQSPSRQNQVKPKVDFKNPDPNATKGCLSFMLAFWFRSAVFSLAIFLAGGNGMVLNRKSLEGPVTCASQEYELTDQDIETFTALINDSLTGEQKEVVYSLGKK